ncbi:hypothetical protein DU508_09175 [Pedobacter chinensis]|uniref:Uncharacterized protein n=1 Tax=Pedobacter chinensis TaxID=2282421 RepID=A0A369Q4U4_9SPHI|nr:hypothetical protein [Pedobacter chinensis]RDC57328.1 hypothetical protein DU508_09175 [Pedobacter chinensis]
MQNENIALQAKVFLYHLNNSNSENGFRPEESWKFSLVNEEGKTAIERDYYPTVSTRVDPKVLLDFSNSVILHLKSAQPKLTVDNPKIEAQAESEYFIAYSLTRARR